MKTHSLIIHAELQEDKETVEVLTSVKTVHYEGYKGKREASSRNNQRGELGRLQAVLDRKC